MFTAKNPWLKIPHHTTLTLILVSDFEDSMQVSRGHFLAAMRHPTRIDSGDNLFRLAPRRAGAKLNSHP